MRMFGTNGIRGVANGLLTCELAMNVGRAVARVMGPKPVAVAMDTRLSSDMLRCALSSGLMSMGCDVIDIGMVPTPALQYYVKTHDVAGGVMITASHNPPEFNGIKCISADGTECSREEESAIEDAYEAGCETAPWSGVGHVVRVDDAGEQYIDAVASRVDVDAIRRAGLKVCLDCANGASVNTSPMLLERLGVQAQVINGTPDGMFPGHFSEPTEENLAELKRIVASGDADLGIAHDGDADRCIFVTGSGRFVPGDMSLAIIAKRMLEANGGKGEIVSTIATSSMVSDVVGAAGGEMVCTAVGSPLVARRMIEDKALFGGEENGGLIFTDHQFCRDGAMTIARMLEAVATSGPLDAQVDLLPKYCTVKEGAYCDDSRKAEVVEKMKARCKDGRINDIDGLRIDYDDGWVLLRPSGTEPKFRIYSESRDPAVARRRADDFKRMFQEILGS